MNHHQKLLSSASAEFTQVLDRHLSRRTVLRGSLLAALGSLLPASSLQAAGQRPLIGFRPVPVASGHGPLPTISPDYEFQVLIPWGTPLSADVPAWDGHPLQRPTARQQEQQVGIGHDGMTFFPFQQHSDHGLLVINHEFGYNQHMLGKSSPTNLEELRRSQHAHGVSVVELQLKDGVWNVVRESAWNRRIHARSPVRFSGPAAGSPWLKPEQSARGTLNNCSNGHTPWQTYLTCEENFDDYFGANKDWTPSDRQARYGLIAAGQGYDWHHLDPRFDLSSEQFPGEENRFGWVVEIDPFDPDSVPVKRTALGRFKHEGAALVEGGDGRVVVYMGDDERFNYIYKFVSSDDWRKLRERGQSPLDHGTLYVARFNDDGSGVWLPLSMDSAVLRERFESTAEMLTFTREAADLVGATPMDRPEWTAVGPDGSVFCTLTNNTERQEPTASNPRAPNPHGHIIRWRDSGNHLGTTFSWDIFLIADETHGTDDPDTLSSPDGLWIDPDGRVFIATDGDQEKGLNNQLLVAAADAEGRPVLHRLLSGVTDCEVTGITTTPDRRTLFVNIQHPGNGDPTLTCFPAPPGSQRIPRDCTLAIRRKDGGIVGS